MVTPQVFFGVRIRYPSTAISKYYAAFISSNLLFCANYPRISTNLFSSYYFQPWAGQQHNCQLGNCSLLHSLNCFFPCNVVYLVYIRIFMIWNAILSYFSHFSILHSGWLVNRLSIITRDTPFCNQNTKCTACLASWVEYG